MSKRSSSPFVSRKLFLLMIFAVFLSACWVMTLPFFLNHSLYWDNRNFYSLFRDTLHSLNIYGEIPWWYSQNQMGWPGYYYGILGDMNLGGPLFVPLAALFYLLGRVGVEVTQYHGIYTAYFGILTPALFLLATYGVLREWIQSQRALLYGMILAAFAPGMIFNLSDIGFLEPIVYFLFFLGSLLRFLREPTHRRYWILVFTVQILAVSFNYTALFWNVLFLPLSIFAFAFFPLHQAKSTLRAFQQQGPWRLAVGLLLAAVAISPNLIILSQGADLVRTRMGQRYYSLFDLTAGNPLEFLLTSLPFFGFEWDQGFWSLLQANRHIGFTYMGLLSLPLVLLALKSLPRTTFIRALILLLGAALIVNLASFSPFFSMLLALPSPLNGNNHFGDALFRGGGYLIILALATLGFQALEKASTAKTFFGLVIGVWLVNIVIGITFHGEGAFASLTFGYLIFVGLIFLVLFLRERKQYLSATTLSLFLVLTLLDVSQVANFYLRQQLVPAADRIDDRANANGLGLSQEVANVHANSILMYQPLFEMTKANFNFSSIPQMTLFTRAHVNANLQDEINQNQLQFNSRSLAFDSESSPEFDIRPYINDQNPLPTGEILSVEQTYSRWRIRLKVDRPALFFLRDAYSPYWKATLNDQPAPVLRAFYNFKAVPLVAGENAIELRFTPPKVPWLMLIAYLTLLGSAGRLVLQRLKSQKT